MAGSILNLSSKVLWVVETDSGPAVAHKLQPQERSPRTVDADGVKAVDGTAISGHTSWWKFRLIEVEVLDDGLGLRIRRCISPACDRVEEGEFGLVTFDPSPGWGEPILCTLQSESDAECFSEPDAAESANGRVAKAKELYAAQGTYPKGCSGFAAAVLGIAWEDANSMMGSAPVYVGVNNSYTNLTPGDLVGWKESAGSGHVAVYIGEPGQKFIDVRDEGDKPRKVVNGYGSQKLYKSSKY